jgi:hypothetical protein
VVADDEQGRPGADERAAPQLSLGARRRHRTGAVVDRTRPGPGDLPGLAPGRRRQHGLQRAPCGARRNHRLPRRPAPGLAGRRAGKGLQGGFDDERLDVRAAGADVAADHAAHRRTAQRAAVAPAAQRASAGGRRCDRPRLAAGGGTPPRDGRRQRLPTRLHRRWRAAPTSTPPSSARATTATGCPPTWPAGRCSWKTRATR